MPRNISFSMTTPQFLAGTKDVTRRMGWENLKAGDMLRAVEKCMGLKKGEKVKSLGTIRVVSVRREPLREMTDRDDGYGFEEARREGFPNDSPPSFVSFFCSGHKGCTPDSIVTRIEFTRFYGAECGSYPNCAGGCGCGCTKEVERARHAVAPQKSQESASE